MSFLDDMRLHDLSLLQTLDGRVVTYTQGGGSPRVLSGMLQEFTEIVGGESVDVVASRPVLSVRTADILEIQTADQFQIDGQDYEVAVIRPDSEGITELILEKL
ncbi:head-tail joining protein [Rickettsiales bacterium]|nr:head-tail joining protein [Rickettsiales bacterium]